MELLITGSGKDDIIQSYADRLQFPPYWQLNWDSFEECLRDALAQGNALTVRHSYPASVLDANSPYLSIIHDACSDFESFSYRFEEK